MKNTGSLVQKAQAAPKTRWATLALGTLLLVMLGLIYAWSVFIAPLEADFGWNRAETSMTFTLSIILFCAGGLAAGLLSRKLPARALLCLSAGLLLAGFAASSRVSSLPGIYLAYGVLVGLGVGFAYNTIITLVGQWFPDRRGIASGVLLMGFGMGGMILGAATTSLMAQFGWRNVFLALAIVFAVIMLAGALALRAPTAAELAALPQPVQKPGATQAAENLSTRQMLRRPGFWVYFAWSLFLVAAGLVIVGHAAAAAGDMGANGTSAAVIAGLVSISNGGGRILVGLVYDRRGLKPTMWLVNLCALLAPLLLLAAHFTGAMPLLGAGFVLTGIFYGGVPTVNATFISGNYGQQHFAVNFSIVNATLLVAPVIGSYLAGALRTAGGSYAGAYVVMLCFALASLVACAKLKRA
ncbi:MAG: MFS transporter [Oscillospiraceae bacterium]